MDVIGVAVKLEMVAMDDVTKEEDVKDKVHVDWGRGSKCWNQTFNIMPYMP